MKKLSLVLIILSWPSDALSFCFEEASARYGVHITLLWAIAKVESDLHPYAIGYREDGKNKSIYPETADLAKKWIDRLSQKGLDFDLGLGQINKYNIKAYNIDSHNLLDPCYNLYWSAYILRDMIDRHGYTWEGVSRYNGGGLTYAEKVWTAIEGLKTDPNSVKDK